MSRPHFFTEKTDVTDKISIWASTRTEWEREQAIIEGDESPFKYELRTSPPYSDEATKVAEFDVTLQVPSGIDLLAKTIETLREKKEQVMKDAISRSADLTEKINGLLMLAPPDNISGNKPSINIVEPEECYGADTIVERMNDNIPF